VPSSHSSIKYPIREPAPEEYLAGREGWIYEMLKNSNNPKEIRNYEVPPRYEGF
jgi:hypothetical protein